MDAVVTWVDGADPSHKEKRALYATERTHPDATGATRFANLGELRFCILSLLRFCPFLNCIHIVTDGQNPTPIDDLLTDPEHRAKIRVVHHNEIFGDHADLLPVFSSRSIETMLHRIPNLCERFIYLNDDIFIGRLMTEADFFEEDLPVLQGRYKRFPSPFSQWLKSWKRPRPGYGSAQRDAARVLGKRDRYFLLEHQPQPMRRSTLAEYFAEHPTFLREQITPRFRSSAQVSPLGLSCHLELAKGAPTKKVKDVGYVKPGRPTGSALSDTMKKLNQGAFASFCVQSLDMMSLHDREIILTGLRLYYEGTVDA